MRKMIVVLALSAVAWGQNAPLPQQQMCMEQANKVIAAEKESRASMNESPIVAFGYTDTNHFNARDNICYVTTRVTMRTLNPFKQTLISISVKDAFQGDDAALFTADGDGKVTGCFVEAKECHSEKEFLTLAYRMQYRRGR